MNEENPLMVNLDKKTWECEFDNTIKVRPQCISDFEMKMDKQKEFDKMLEIWTQVSPEIMNEYRAEYLNQIDITAISPSNVFFFCIPMI